MKFNKLALGIFMFSSIIITAQTSPTIAELEEQKAKASSEENFKLAGELKIKIQALKDKEKLDIENAKIQEEALLKEKIIAELAQKQEAETREKERLAEEQRKKAEVEEFKKEIEEATRKKKEEDAVLLKEQMAAEQKQKAAEKIAEQAALKEKLALEQKQKAAERASEQVALKERLAAEQKQKAAELALIKEKQTIEQKQKTEEQALLKAKLGEDLKQRAEEQLLEKEIALAGLSVKKETEAEVKNIEAEIAKAIVAENYLLAEELKGKIKTTKDNGEIRLASVAGDIKRKKEEKKAQEKQELEKTESQRLLMAAELERKKENAEAIENLEKEKAKAIADANYILAEELKVKINALKTDSEAAVKHTQTNAPETELERLEKAKKAAIASSDFKLAEELKIKINALKAGTAHKSQSAQASTSSADPEISKLEKQKADAIANSDFKLAGELKEKIRLLKEESGKKAVLNTQITELEKQKAKAVSDGDFKLAGELKTKIQNLKDPNYNKPVNKPNSQNSTASKTSARTSGSNLAQQQQYTQSTPVSKIENASLRISRSGENESTGIKYRRSSLYTLMVNNTARERSDVIKDAFIKSPLPVNFNDHNLTIATVDVSSNSNASNLVNNMNSYFQTNKIAKELVAKWFNRNEKGCFNMDLIKERGEYNASNIDLNLAKNSSRGLALLADAGEELIANTYVVINDFRFTNKEEVANKTKAGLGLLSAVSSLAGGPDLSAATTIASAGATVAGKGYVVRNTSYLFQLVWNPEVAASFYQDYWVDESNYSENKKQAFDESNLFTLKYVGTESGLADLQSTIFTNKTEDELIYKATTKAVDNGIAKLQRKFEQFRVKTPLYSVNPLSAKIGLKEDLKAGDRFEVLEQVMDENGKLSYMRKGIITVDGREIWDNTNTIEELEEAGKASGLTNQYTTFKGSGDYAPGMLIRQIN